LLIKIYKQEGKSEKHVETLTVYMVLATIIGARLGHCLFYQPEIYLKNPIEILYIWEGGLASHGAAVGILFAIFLYSRKQTDQSYFYVLDRMVITIALAACLIRLGNLMNSEIYGKQTDLPFGFVYVKGVETEIEERYNNFLEDVEINNLNRDTTIAGHKYPVLDLSFYQTVQQEDNKFLDNFITREIFDHLHYGQHSDLRENVLVPEGPLPYRVISTKEGNQGHITILGIPRHPTQIYESFLYFLLFLYLMYVYNKYKSRTSEGRILGLFMFILFSVRFVVEFLKVPQVEFENNLTLNMGQLLSIPIIVAGLFILLRSFKQKNEIS